ncbi:MAG: transporter substrate-binding domain-containing protein [Firmicutes bacterium]|nr:transporter substrate-binding domain-containing protein [Bacillota bacterium]
MKRAMMILLIILSFTVLVGCQNASGIQVDQDNYNYILDQQEIVVGLECQYAPFNWTVEESNASVIAVQIDGSQNYCDGYDVQVALAIASELNVNLVLKAIEWDGLIASLADSGQIDLIIAGMSPTSDRAQTVSFTNEYYHSTHVVVLRSDSIYNTATSIDDFEDATIVGQLSTIYDSLIDQMTNAVHENPLTDVPTIITAIKTGTIDATILELPVAIAVCEANSDLMYIEFTSDNGFDVSYEDSAVAIALRQGDVLLLERINEILASISIEQREVWMIAAIDRQP